MRFAVISDTHLSPAGTPDGTWNNATRKSASASLVSAAVAQIVAAGHDRVLVLGDVSEFGADSMIATVLRTISDAGLRSWVVPGNHDVAISPEAVTRAAETSASSVPLQTERHERYGEVAVLGYGLRSQDGGHTCQATDLPDLTPVQARLLVWASHYPVLSQQDRLRAAGLRYPGDLLNLAEARAAAERFRGPILVLHGHLHTAIVGQAGRILQIGSPAVVEWPHGWTDTLVELTGDTVAVRTALTVIPGHWSTGNRNTILDERQQNWVFTAGRWRRAAG